MEQKVTVITICRNESKGIRRTIESVLSQTYKNIEYVVVDGNSTDGTVEIIQSYINRISFFISERDTGIYNAMNKGIRASTGQYLLFLNGGDCLKDKTVVEKMVGDGFNEDIVFGDILFNLGRGKTIKQGFEGAVIDVDFMLDNYIPHPTSFIKKALFIKHGLYDEKFKIAGDYEFFFREIVRNRVKVKHKPIVVTVFNMGGMSANPKFKDLQQKERVLAQMNNLGRIKYALFQVRILRPGMRRSLFRSIKNRLFRILKNIGKIFVKFVFNECRVIIMQLYNRRKMEKKVLVVGDFGSFGGSRDYYKAVVIFLKENGYDVTASYSRSIADSDMRTYLKDVSIKSREFPNYSVHEYVYCSLVQKIIRFTLNYLNQAYLILVERPSLVIVSSGSLSYLSFFSFPIKLIYVTHIYPSAHFIDKLSHYLLLHYFDDAKTIIAVSQYTKNQLHKYIVPQKYSDQIHVIHPTFKQWEPLKHVKQEKNVVLTVGHVADSKGPDVWMRVAHKVTDIVGADKVDFVWVGGGFQTDRYLNDLRKEVASSTYRNIWFVGFDKDVEKYYAEATVYFQPSRLESFGLCVVDSMRYGLPLLTSSAGGLPELNEDMVTGYVVPLEQEELMVRKLVTLLTDKALRKKFGGNARKRYLKDLNYESWAVAMRQELGIE